MKGKCKCGYEVSGEDLPSYKMCPECGELFDIPGGYDPFERIASETDQRVGKQTRTRKEEPTPKEDTTSPLTEKQVQKCIDALTKREWKWFLYDWIGVSKEWEKKKKFHKVFPKIENTELRELMSQL